MLKHTDPEATIVGLEPGDELALDCADVEVGEEAYRWGDDVDELVLIKHELREMRRELSQTRESVEHALRLVRRRDRLHSMLRTCRQDMTRGGKLARAILRLMVAVFTLGGIAAGAGVALTVSHVWGDNRYATLAAGFFGLAVALAAWLAAALAAIVLETADSVRDLP